MGKDAVCAKGLSRSFDGVPVVRGLDLRVRYGEVVGLVGPNGAGKTTTLRMLATLLSPSQGEVEVAGYSAAREPVQVRRHIGYLTGDTGLYGRLTAEEMIRYFGRLHGLEGERLQERVTAMAELVGIGSQLGKRCEALSTGQRQRVSIARALVHDPQVLILDEPTSGLDLLAARDILSAFRRAADAGKAVILSSHVMAEVELICDRALVIHRGRILARGTLTELMGSGESLDQSFLGLLDRADAAGGAR